MGFSNVGGCIKVAKAGGRETHLNKLIDTSNKREDRKPEGEPARRKVQRSLFHSGPSFTQRRAARR
jgi:hypothetical protein